MTQKKNLPGSALAAVAILLATLVAADPVIGQSWPARPIRVISPIGAGSAADILSRTFSEQLSAQLGQPVLVENRPGAGGTLGVNVAAKAPADGYTMLIHSNGHTSAPAVYPNLPYDPVADFTAITTLANFPNVLVVAPAKNIRTAQALAAAARSKPGAFTYASGGIGTPTHLAAERFRLSAAFEAQHVPFKGQVEALTETMTGRVDFYFCPVFPALPLIRDGKLLPLAVSSSKRVSSLPVVPTTLEAGFANSDFNFWVGMFVPANTPPAVVKRLHDETLKAMQVPALQEKLAKLGVEPMTMTPEQFSAYVKTEIVANAALVKAAGITAQ
jgi:tripartite-type tricarboxylate transporter receptor subunit TctC